MTYTCCQVKFPAVVHSCVGVVHGEPLMVLRCEVKESGAGSFHQCNPCIRIVLLWVPCFAGKGAEGTGREEGPDGRVGRAGLYATVCVETKTAGGMRQRGGGVCVRACVCTCMWGYRAAKSKLQLPLIPVPVQVGLVPAVSVERP